MKRDDLYTYFWCGVMLLLIALGFLIPLIKTYIFFHFVFKLW